MNSSICGVSEGCQTHYPMNSSTFPPSLLLDTCSFADLLILVALTARLEVAEKALFEERDAQLAVDQFLAK
jgi:hypothetical protein